MTRTLTAPRRLLLLWVALSLSTTSFAGPIAGDRLVLKRNGTRERLTFKTTDPSWSQPQPPALDNGPGPIRVEFISPAEPAVTELDIPSLDAPIVWRASRAADGSVRRYRYRNATAPNALGDLKSAQLRADGRIQLSGTTLPLVLTGPQGQIGLRITLTTGVVCALFRADNIVIDRADVFVARGALAANLTDCSDASLGIFHPCSADVNLLACVGECPAGQECLVDNPITPSCHCVGASQPCGETAPTCNGTCPESSVCAVTQAGTLGNTCACIPAGGCGNIQQCGGSCPVDAACYTYSGTVGQFVSYSGCTCADPTPCNCSGGLACPAGTSCRVQQVPNLCFAACQ